MQNETQPDFKFNGKVAIILLLTAGALFVPLAGVVVALRSEFGRPSAEEQKKALEPLKQGFESAASASLAAPGLRNDEAVIHLKAQDLRAETSRIEKLARLAGGMALADPPTEQSVRILVSLPANRVEAFAAACRTPGVQPSAEGKDGETSLVEVLVERPTS